MCKSNIKFKNEDVKKIVGDKLSNTNTKEEFVVVCNELGLSWAFFEEHVGFSFVKVFTSNGSNLDYDEDMMQLKEATGHFSILNDIIDQDEDEFNTKLPSMVYSYDFNSYDVYLNIEHPM